MSKITAILAAFCLLLSSSGLTAPRADAAPVRVLLGSDFQNACGDDPALYDQTPIDGQPRAEAVRAILQAVATSGEIPDAVCFVGDYSDHPADAPVEEDSTLNTSEEGAGYLTQQLDAFFGVGYAEAHPPLFTQGNHDPADTPQLAADGLQPVSDDAAYLVYVVNEDSFPTYEVDETSLPVVQATADRIRADLQALADQGEQRPILFLSHLPLHYSARYDGRDNTYANLIFRAINDTCENLNLFYIYGHDHTGAEFESGWGGAVNYVARGQTLDINFDGHDAVSRNDHALNFTYLNAGYIGYSASTENATLTMTMLTIGGTGVTISRFCADGLYTRPESLGQTDPRVPEQGAVENYPLSVPLAGVRQTQSFAVQTQTGTGGSVACMGSFYAVRPQEDYSMDGFSVEPADAAAVFRRGELLYLSRLTADCTLSVTFREDVCYSSRLADVDKAAWYHESVDYVLKNQIMSGTDEQSFSPDETMSRAAFITALWHVAGSPSVLATQIYDDVPTDSWYAKAVTWAELWNVTHAADTDYRFRPDAPITREEIALCLGRYAMYTGRTVRDSGNLAEFSDGDSVSPAARTPCSWAVESGLLGAVDDGRLAPLETATRAQVAAILARFSQRFMN